MKCEAVRSPGGWAASVEPCGAWQPCFKQTWEEKSWRFVLRLSFIWTDLAWLRSLPLLKKEKKNQDTVCASVSVCV